MQTKPKTRLSVSVIVPTYNRADLLVEALESALRQTRMPDEILVVDDGSTDNTADVLAKYGPPVVAIRQKNQGVSAARNLAMQRATGDVLLFLDSDDLLLPTCVERCAQVLESQPEVDIVYSDLNIIDGEGNLLGVYSDVERGERRNGDLLGELGCRCIVNMTSGALRRTALQHVRFDESLPCAQDYDFWCQLATRCHFQYVHERLSCYRYHGDQVTTLKVDQMLDEAIEVQQRVLQMPEFSRVSSSDRARIYCTHGVKHALRRRTSTARQYFWKAACAKPTQLTGHALFAISLLGGGVLRWAIAVRRSLAGNYIEGRVMRRSAARRAAAKPAPSDMAKAAVAGAVQPSGEVVHQ